MSLVARRPQAVLLFVALALFSAASAFGQCGSLGSPSTTANAGAQDFNTNGDWSNNAPNSTTNACIINGSAVTLAAGGTGNVLNLQLNAANSLTLANDSQLNVYGTQIINGGSINITPTANLTVLQLQDSSTLSGGGTLTLNAGSGGTAIIDQAVGGLTLTNQSTIQGAGIIGNNGLALTNSGTVDANSSGNVLTLNGGTITNTGGTLEATGGGILNIIGTAVTNGNITASGAGSTVNINSEGAGNVITGATLTSTGGGVLQTLADQYASFSNITLTTGSTFTNGNDAYMYINGTITNQGTINIASGVNSSILWLNGNTTLTGGGTITLSGAAGAYIDQTVGGLTLTNTNNTIQATGTAFIGSNNVALINQATVDATGASANLTLEGPQTNNAGGTLEATNSGTLNIANSVSGGLILANGGTVNIEGSVTSFPILNATLTSENGGTLQTFPAGYADFDGVTLTAGSTYTNGNDAYLYFNNTITNNGTINIAAGVNSSILWMNNNVTLTGTGTLELSTTGAGGNALIDQVAGGLTLTNQSTIAGAGIIGVAGLAVVNQSTINANTTGQTLFLEGPVTNTGGIIEATNNGILQIDGDTVNNSGGTIQTNTGGIVQLMGSGTVQGGTLSGNFETINTDNFTLDGSTNGALTLATGSTYNVDNDSFLYVKGSIVNNGAINLNAGNNNTDLFLQANTTLSGTGTLTLGTSGGGTANLEQQIGGLTLTNQETIQGAGTIGVNGLTVANQATIDANTPGQTLFLEGPVTNTGGIIEATNNGTLQIDGDTINNFGGTIQTNTGGIVQLMDTGTVQGGTLSGNFETINNNNFILDGSTNGAITFAAGSTYNVDNDSYLYVKGSIVNNGAINLNAGNNNTILWLQANTTLSGTGTLTLGTTGGGTALIDQTVGGLTLTNQSTIQGTGVIGSNNVAVVNGASGTLLARDGDSLTIEGSGGLTNNGTMQVNAGGTMTVTTNLTNFSGGTLTGGTYIVNGASGNNGTMQISLGANTGGEITTNAATIVLNGPTASTKFVDSNGNNLLSALATNSGSLTLEGGYSLNTTGNVTNSGTVNVGSPVIAGASALNPGSGTSEYIQSGGTTTLYSNGTLNALVAVVNGGTVQGTGTINAGDGTDINNGGTLLPGLPGAPGTIAINGTLAINGGGTLTEGINGAGAGQFGVTSVSGDFSTTGTPSLNLVGSTGVQNGTTPIGVGTQLVILTSAGITGGFTNAELTGNTTFDGGLETWTVAKVGNNEVLNATPTAGFVTATWGSPSPAPSGTTGNWTTATEWGCNVPVAGYAPDTCVPNNGTPAGINYKAVLNSGPYTANVLTLNSSVTVNEVDINAGSLAVASGGTLNVTGDINLNSGSTQVQMSGGTINVSGTLTNNGNLIGTDYGITGYGTITGTGSFNNVSTVSESGPSGSTLDLSTIAVSNYNAGTQTLTGGGWYVNGTNGVLKLPGDITTLTGSGAIYIGAPGASVEDAGGGNALAGLNLVQTGELGVANGGTFTTGGNLTLNNFGNLSATGPSPVLTVSGNLTLTNNSTVYTVGAGNPQIIVTGGVTLDSTSQIEVQNTSTVSVGTNLNINGGTVVTGNFPGDAGGNSLIVGGNLNNTGGTLTLMAAGDLAMIDANLNNTSGGVVTANNGSSISVLNALTNDGTSTVQIQNGSSLTALEINNSGALATGNAPSDSGGNSIAVGDTVNNLATGTISLGASGDSLTAADLSNAGAIYTVAGTLIDIGLGPFVATTGYEQSNGTLTEVISSASQFGVINVANGVQLDAASNLTINLEGGYDPANGTKFNIITDNGTESGGFTITDPTFNGGTQQWTISYSGNDITLTAGAVSSASVTATWGNVAPSANTSGNWTDATEWSCTPPAIPANCVPNNGGGTTYAAILNSSVPGNTLTLNSPVTVNSVDIQNGTLEIDGGTLTLNGGPATVELGAFLSSDGSSTINGTGTFTNNGTVTVNSGTLNLVNAGVTNLAADTLTGGLWQAGNGVSSGFIQFNSDITTNSAGIILENPGSQIQDSLGNDALAGLTSNNGGGLTLFSGATESITPGGGTFTNGNGSSIEVSFGGSSLTINGNLINSNGSDITVNGNFGGASFSVTGDLTNQDTSTIEVNHGGVLGIGGNLNLQGGTITVSDITLVEVSQINVTGNVTVGGVALADPTLQIQNGASMTIGGNLINNANGNVYTGNAPSDTGGNTLTIGGTLTNNGTVELYAAGDSITIGNTTNPGTAQLSNSGTLTVNNATAAFNINQQGATSNNTNSGIINLTGSLNFTNDAGQQTFLTGGGTINLSGGSITTSNTLGTYLQTDNNITGFGSITGPQFDTTGQIVPSGTITITPSGGGFTDNGSISVNGAGNVLAIVGTGGAGSTTIGYNLLGTGAGTMTVENGGSFTSQSFVTVGFGAGGNGTLDVLLGGTASTGTLAVGFNNSMGTVLINGAGSQYTDSGDLDIDSANGKVTVSGGGTLSLVNGTVNNGSPTLTGGTLIVGGGGGSSLLSAETFNQSSGTTTVANGGTISVSGVFTETGGSVDIQAGGAIDPTSYFVNGGTTEVDGSLTATTVSVANGAELTGNGGTITGNLINDGTLSPGTGVAPGTLTVNGNVNLAGAAGANDGTFLELIAGLNNFGVLDDTAANGVVTLGGTLQVDLLGGYQPVVGNTFTFIDPFADNGIFTTLNLPAAPAGDEYIVQYNAANTELCFVSAANPVCGAPGTTTPPAVPEPKSVVLLSTVIAAALWIHRKRRQKVAAKA